LKEDIKPMAKEKMQRMTLDFPVGVYKNMKREAKRQHRHMVELVRDAVSDYLTLLTSAKKNQT
jgi:hypothetical protein